MRRLLVPIAAGLGLLVAGPAHPAFAKEQTRARLDNAAQLRAAAPGERVRVAWTLDGAARLPVPDHARPHGMALYVVVTGAGGGPAARFAARPAGPDTPGLPAGPYVADVTVPGGGIGAIAIDVEGAPEDAGAIAPARIPIDNPFSASAAAGEPGSGPPWVVLAALAALGAAAAARMTLRRSRLRAPEDTSSYVL